MLRVTVEIVPYGLEVNKRTLAIYQINNIGTSSNDVAKYEVLKNDIPVGKVKNHKRSEGFEKLLVRVFKMLCKGG